jgi:hypothetical protein
MIGCARHEYGDDIMTKVDYWLESLEMAFDSEGLYDVLISNTSLEQRESIARGLEVSAENQSLAFHTPSSADRYAQIEREWRARCENLREELEAYRSGAEIAMKQALKIRGDAGVTITPRGEVFVSDGRTTQVM